MLLHNSNLDEVNNDQEIFANVGKFDLVGIFFFFLE